MKAYRIANIVKFAFANRKIPRPRDPTVAQSFQTEISPDQMKILLDPKGFMSEEEKLREESNQPKTPQEEQKNDMKSVANQKVMEPQYGFKPKGPEPTRYGDWEVKGKCVDF